MLGRFYLPGHVSFICGGNYGSEGKGAAAAFVARHLAEYGKFFSIVTTNAGVQSGHTSVHSGKKHVVYHLPTYPLIASEYGHKSVVYLNAGSVIDPDILMQELAIYSNCIEELIIHPNAAIIDDECREAEMKANSQQTLIASTRKGVGQALARKVLRTGTPASHNPYTKIFTWRRKGLDLNTLMMTDRKSVLAEIPQGYSLGIDAGFYPFCTSRNCTPMQAMSDAGIHPSFYGHTMMVVRTFPIRVGNIYDATGQMIGNSGATYDDQRELKWEDIGVEAEITTVTKRVRRVFTFSERQFQEAVKMLMPSVVMLTFCDYEKDKAILEVISNAIKNIWPCELIYAYGPTTNDVVEAIR